MENPDAFAVRLPKAARPPIIRTAFISLNMAADLARANAKEQGVDIGDRIGLTAEEWTNLNPLKRAQ